MSYNIVKRVLQKTRQDISIEKSQIGSYFKKVYGYAAEELQKEDEAYRKLIIPNQYELRLLEDFKKIPFIKAFCYSGLEESDFELKEEKLNSYLSQVIGSLTVIGKINMNEHDVE